MKNYLLILIAGAFLLFAPGLNSVPINFEENDHAIIVDDVGISANVEFAVSYDMQTHGLGSRTTYLSFDHSSPINELVKTPGWQSRQACEVTKDNYKRLLVKHSLV